VAKGHSSSCNWNPGKPNMDEVNIGDQQIIYINQKHTHKSEENYIDDSKDHLSLERIVVGDNHLKYA